MARYKIEYKMATGECINVDTAEQPEAIHELAQKMTATNYQTYICGENATVVNMRNVLWVSVRKEEENGNDHERAGPNV